jgi:GAF domain-containing protein
MSRLHRLPRRDVGPADRDALPDGLPPSIGRQLASNSRSLHTEGSTASTLERAVLLAVQFIPGAEEGAISLLYRDGSLETPVATSETAERVDRIQYETGTGPGVEGLREREVVHVGDLGSDPRWGEWGRRVVEETGIRSMLCFRLFTNEERLGALNLHSQRPHAFTSDDVENGLALAAQAAVALSSARTDHSKDLAMDNRATIGQATGMLMERFNLEPDRAFEVLLRLSQDSNRKLRDIAAEIVRTRAIPR